MAKTTEIVIYDSRRKQQHMPPPPLPGIARVDSLRVLGVTLTRRLSASDHIRQVVGDCSQSLCTPCVCCATTAWPMSASTPCSGQSSSQSCCTPVQHGVDLSQRLTNIASTRSSSAANAVATVIQTFQLSTNFLRRVTIGCFTNSVVTLYIHYITFSRHPPRHHNTTTSAVHQHITDNYQHAQATSPTATSSHAYCIKIVTELLSQCDYLRTVFY